MASENEALILLKLKGLQELLDGAAKADAAKKKLGGDVNVKVGFQGISELTQAIRQAEASILSLKTAAGKTLVFGNITGASEKWASELGKIAAAEDKARIDREVKARSYRTALLREEMYAARGEVPPELRKLQSHLASGAPATTSQQFAFQQEQHTREMKALKDATLKRYHQEEATSSQRRGGGGGGYGGADAGELFGRGTGIRRVLGMALQASLGNFASGMAAILGASLFMPMIWKIGNALLGAPGEFLGERETRGRYLAGALTTGDKETYRQALLRGEGAFRGTSEGTDPWMAGMEHFQSAGISPAVGVPAMAALMRLSIGSPGGPKADTMAGQIAKMLTTWETGAAEGVIQQPAMMNAFRDMFPKYGLEGGYGQRMKHLITGGNLAGPKDVMEALLNRAQYDPTVSSFVTEAVSGSGMSQVRGDWRKLIRAFEHPSEHLEYLRSSNPERAMSELMSGTARNEGPWQAHPAPMSGGFYEFTSGPGLAEKMQMMASDAAGDSQQRSADYLQEIVEKGVKIQKAGPAHAPPQGGSAPGTLILSGGF